MEKIRFGLRAAVATALAASALTGLAMPAHAQRNREIFVQNECPAPVRFLISHADQNRNWHPHGWWEFRANQPSTRLLVDDRVITQRDDHDLYFYAESTDNSGHIWDGTDHSATWVGVTYRMQRANMAVVDGGLQLTLTCE